MANIQDFKKWLERDFSPKDVVHVITDQAHGGSGKSEHTFRIFLYTATNRFSITAISRDPSQKDYLGCIAQSRKARTGEDWLRGNDLPDGDLSENTWQQILIGILRYELQTICRETTVKVAA